MSRKHERKRNAMGKGYLRNVCDKVRKNRIRKELVLNGRAPNTKITKEYKRNRLGCFWSHRENEWGLNCKPNIWKNQVEWKDLESHDWMEFLKKRDENNGISVRLRKIEKYLKMILSPVALVHFSSINYNYISKFYLIELIEIKFFIKHFRYCKSLFFPNLIIPVHFSHLSGPTGCL